MTILSLKDFMKKKLKIDTMNENDLKKFITLLSILEILK